MRPRHRYRSGFTLVELMLVLAILGVLSAVVIPQFSNAATTAREGGTRALLHRLRGQLELYRVEHGNKYPLLSELWDGMTQATDESGALDLAGGVGPYLMSDPINQYTRSFSVVAVGTGTSADGWEYDETTGAITAVGFDEETGTYTAP